MTAVVEQQLVSETVQHVTDESGSGYFPTPKKGRKIVELPQSSEEEHEVPPNCLFWGRPYIIFRNSFLCGFMLVYIYIYMWQAHLETSSYAGS